MMMTVTAAAAVLAAANYISFQRHHIYINGGKAMGRREVSVLSAWQDPLRRRRAIVVFGDDASVDVEHTRQGRQRRRRQQRYLSVCRSKKVCPLGDRFVVFGSRKS
jgi:hypothetical protein